MEDGNVILERVRHARKTRYRKTRAKVNTAFNDEFATNDKRANKNMREWYEQHIGVSIYLAVLCNYAIISHRAS